jgi:hypothetical protein
LKLDAARAGNIFNDHVLAEHFTHPRGDDAAQDVGRSARGERDDHGHRPVGKVLGMRRKSQKRGAQRRNDCGFHFRSSLG